MPTTCNAVSRNNFPGDFQHVCPAIAMQVNESLRPDGPMAMPGVLCGSFSCTAASVSINLC